MSITHSFVSGKSDGGDSSLVRPSDWNAAHIGAVEVPSGLIAMWHGLISAIPSGWVLCNGSNGTPDLRSKFVAGAPASTEAGTTGGASAKVLDSVAIASLNASMNGYVATAGDPATSVALQTNPAGASSSGYYFKNSITDARPAYYEILFIMKS